MELRDASSSSPSSNIHKLTGVDSLDGKKKLSSKFRTPSIIKTHTRI